MHLYCITRGIKHEVDQLIKNLESQWFKLPEPFVDKITGRTIQWVQMGVRPIQLWEMVFPKDNLDEVLRTVLTDPHVPDWKGKFLMAQLRKQLKAKPIPPYDKEGQRRITSNLCAQNVVEVSGIGIKDDLFSKEDGHEML